MSLSAERIKTKLVVDPGELLSVRSKRQIIGMMVGLNPANLRTKRYQAQLGEFKMLQPEWNSDYGQTKYQPDNQMAKSKFPAEYQQPDNIEYQPASPEVPQYDYPPKRPQHKSSYLEALQPKRYTDDGDA